MPASSFPIRLSHAIPRSVAIFLGKSACKGKFWQKLGPEAGAKSMGTHPCRLFQLLLTICGYGLIFTGFRQATRFNPAREQPRHHFL